jgi:hypothetical protein
MTTEILYQYLGTNGTILSPVHLEDIYYIRKLKITADKGKVLTNKLNPNTKLFSTIIPEDDLSNWEEKILVESE